jgi:serine phosphatase RsbU (regulator of sigma subunit)
MIEPRPDRLVPRLERLVSRRELSELLLVFAPLLEGRRISVENANGVTLAEAGVATAEEGVAWRAELLAAGGAVGAVEVAPAPGGIASGGIPSGAGAYAAAAVAALHATLQRTIEGSAARRELAAETLERYREVNLLYRLGDILGGTLDATAIPERALDEALRLIEAPCAALRVDPDGDDEGTLTLRGAADAGALAHALDATRAHLDDEGRSAIVGEADEPAGARVDDAHAIRLWAPLRARERSLGGLLLARPAGSAVFSAGDAKLLSALASQAAAYLDNAGLHRRSLQQARFAQELQLAHDVQARLMPRVMPSSPGWRLAASWQPAREVAGDFFDATASGGEIAVAVGDVADKGMAAALFMALTRSVLRASAAPGRSAADVVAAANALLCADATDGMFVTLVYALLAADGTVRYANAGHNPPLVIRADGSVERLERTGILVGWDEAAPYGEAHAALAPGDLLVLYTDGVTEARDGAGGEYGEERLEGLLVRYRTASAATLLELVLADLASFVGGAEPYDDATLMVVAREAP